MINFLEKVIFKVYWLRLPAYGYFESYKLQKINL